MTVNTATNTATYTGNGSTTVFPVPFYFLANADLLVLQKFAATGATSTLVLGTNYSLVGAGVESGGSLTTTVAPTTGDTLYIARNVSAVQQTAYPANSPFPAASHEMALDRLTMLAQQLQTAQALALQKPALSSTYDLGGNTLINEAVAVNPADVPNLLQVQGMVVAGAVPQLASSTGAALVGFSVGNALLARTVQDVLRDTVNVKNFGAIGDGASHPASGKFATLAAAQAVYPMCSALTDEIDALAFLSAIAYLETGTDSRGGTIRVPRGSYKLNKKLTFTSFDSVTNYYLKGDGILNVTLDFSGCPAATDAIYFNGGSQCGVEGMMVNGATGKGIVINDQAASYVSKCVLRDLRVQGCGSDGIYSFQSYLIGVDNVWSANNGGGGFNFAGNHTSISTHLMYASGNTGAGIRINGAVYIDVNGQSDSNLRGWQLSNIRGGILRSPGTESNRAEGIVLQSSDASATGITGEYQDIHGLTIVGACQIRNNTSGPLGSNANIAVSTSNNRPISFTLIGCVDNVTSGDPSVALSGVSGQITMTELDCQFGGPVVVAGSYERRNLSQVGRSCTVGRSTGAVSVPTATQTTMVWDSVISGQNSMGASLASNGIVIPAGVSSIRAGACVNWASSTGGYRYVAIKKNGVNVEGLPQIRVPAYAGVTQPITVCSAKPIPVATGDVITVVVLQDSGSTITVEGLATASNWMSVEAVS